MMLGDDLFCFHFYFDSCVMFKLKSITNESQIYDLLTPRSSPIGSISSLLPVISSLLRIIKGFTQPLTLEHTSGRNKINQGMYKL